MRRAPIVAIVVVLLVTAALVVAAVRFGRVNQTATATAPEPSVTDAIAAIAAAAPAAAPTAPASQTQSAGPGPLFQQASGPLNDTRMFSIGPFGSVEFGYTLDKGATLIYEWKSTAPLSFDFHTEPAGKPRDSSDSFEQNEAKEGHGGYVSPYPGIHGWFWENQSGDEVTLTLTATGFFTKAILYNEDGTSDSVPITPGNLLRRRGQ